VFDDPTGGRFVSLKRNDLSRAIFAKVADGCEVIFGDSINGVFEDESGVRITFERGKERRFDLVIGADGRYSTVGTLAFGPQERYEKHLGYMAAAFEVSGYRPRDDNMYVIYERPGRQLGGFALRDDRTLFLFVLACDLEPGSYPHVIGDQSSTFAHDEWELLQILSALDGCTELYFDCVSQIRMDNWWQGRVALMGDAAFCGSLLKG
jgi:2-polyprenyl-6-methoxyphenol hydroxylase-like FAD-dependent oxidoreductase